MYSDQTASVKTDKMSRSFNIERGTKQGDPLSSLLFNSLLEHIFKELRNKWSTKKYGIRMTTFTDQHRLTNLRFADDVLLTATSLTQLTHMITDLREEALQHGLQLHPDKTKIMSNTTKPRGREANTHIDIQDMHIEILKLSDSTKYLGRKVTFEDVHTTELDSRIAAAWRKFNILRQELTSKFYPLSSRLRLFDATVTPTVLYACTSWTLTKDAELTLRRVQRRMIRLIIGTPRRLTTPPASNNEHLNPTTSYTNNLDDREDNDESDDADTGGSDVTSNPSEPTVINNDSDVEKQDLEPWIEYIKRATRIAEQMASRLYIEEWTAALWKRQWRWAHRVATQSRNRWSSLAARWDPSIHDPRPVRRQQSRPKKRWDDDIQHFLETTCQGNGINWLDKACDTHRWDELEEAFVQYKNTQLNSTKTTQLQSTMSTTSNAPQSYETLNKQKTTGSNTSSTTGTQSAK